MNVKELKTYLTEQQIPSQSYSLNGGSGGNGKICLKKEGIYWVVYFSERAKIYDEIYFESESTACEFILKELLNTVTAK